MPELPDVDAVIKRIREKALNRSIKGVTVLDRALTTEERLKPILGKRIEGIMWRLKCILFPLDNGNTVVMHLRMTGDLLVAKTKAEIDTHTGL